MISLMLILAAQSISEPVARAEYLATMDSEFAAMDSDGNGWVTPEEVSAKLTQDVRAQALSANRQLFVQLDANNDGMVSAEEFAQLVASAPPADPANYMQRIDLDQDGQVTLLEHRRVMLETFDRLDTDLDGVVTPMEMQAGTAQAAPTP